MPKTRNNDKYINIYYSDVRLKALRQHSSELQKAKTMEDISRVRGEIIRDITYFLEIHHHIIKSEARWQSLVEMAPDGIVTMNLKGFVTSVNNSFLKLTGFSEDEIVGKHFSSLGTVRARDLPNNIKIFASLIRGKVSGPFEMVYKRKDGSVGYGEIHVKIVDIWKKEREVLVITRDITQRKKHEGELLKYMRELESSNHELEDFTYAVSHDLKAPLRTVEAFAGFLIKDYAENLDETGKEYLTRMKNATIRMTGLIDDLLSLSRVGRMQTEIALVDLNELIDIIKRDYDTQIAEVKVEIISSGLPEIRTQRILIQQLFFNLISNGLKFNNSKIPKVWVGYEEKENCHLFSVKDNGIGIEKRYQDKIFKIFQRLHTRDEYPGTGAGLTICKKIVETLGGRIWVESKPGAGSTFYFTIPKEEMIETEVSDYPHEVDQDVIQVQEELTEHAE